MAGWSEGEMQVLRAYYPKYGPTWKGWAEVLPTRTSQAIHTKAVRNGIIKRGGSTCSSTTVTTAMRMFRDGLTPTEIDRSQRWHEGTARKAISAAWGRGLS